MLIMKLTTFGQKTATTILRFSHQVICEKPKLEVHKTKHIQIEQNKRTVLIQPDFIASLVIITTKLKKEREVLFFFFSPMSTY